MAGISAPLLAFMLCVVWLDHAQRRAWHTPYPRRERSGGTRDQLAPVELADSVTETRRIGAYLRPR